MFGKAESHLTCFAFTALSAVASQAEQATVVGHFLIGSSNPVQGFFVNRKHQSLCFYTIHYFFKSKACLREDRKILLFLLYLCD